MISRRLSFEELSAAIRSSSALISPLALIEIKDGKYSHARRMLKRVLRIDRVNPSALRYLREIDEATGTTTTMDIRTRDRRRGRKKNENPDEDLQQNAAVRQAAFRERPAYLTLVNVLFGVLIGIAGAVFVVGPAVRKSLSESTNSRITEYTTTIAAQQSKINDLQQQVDDSTSSVSSAKDQVADLQSTEQSYDNLLQAYVDYQNGDYESAGDAFAKVDNPLLSTEASEIYDSIKSDLQSQAYSSYVTQGQTAFYQENWKDAVSYLEKALALTDSSDAADNYEVMNLLAQAYAENGDTDKAIAEYQATIERIRTREGRNTRSMPLPSLAEPIQHLGPALERAERLRIRQVQQRILRAPPARQTRQGRRTTDTPTRTATVYRMMREQTELVPEQAAEQPERVQVQMVIPPEQIQEQMWEQQEQPTDSINQAGEAEGRIRTHMNNEAIVEIQRIVGADNAFREEPMSRHTTFRIGGPADLMVCPTSGEAVAETVRFCRGQEIPWFIIGNGSNLLVSDEGYRGVIIRIDQNLQHVHTEGSIIHAEAGILLSRLAAEARDHSLAGLEFAPGIPGTLGGACTMNAGAYGGEIRNVLKSVTVLDENLEVRVVAAGDLDLGYRHSRIMDRRWIVLEAEVSLTQGDREQTTARMNELRDARNETAAGVSGRQHLQEAEGDISPES